MPVWRWNIQSILFPVGTEAAWDIAYIQQFQSCSLPYNPSWSTNLHTLPNQSTPSEPTFSSQTYRWNLIPQPTNAHKKTGNQEDFNELVSVFWLDRLVFFSVIWTPGSLQWNDSRFPYLLEGGDLVSWRNKINWQIYGKFTLVKNYIKFTPCFKFFGQFLIHVM